MFTQAQLQTILDYNPATGIFKWRYSRRGAPKGWRAGSITSNGYRVIRLHGVLYLEHRLAWFYVYGTWPPKYIDHKNRAKTNNSIAELRLATQSKNMANATRPKTNTSGYKGVSFHRGAGRWMAGIKVNKKAIYLGLFNTPQQAHAAYVAAAKQHYGAFARFV